MLLQDKVMGGIWTANGAYSFITNDNSQIDVTINIKFGTWNYDDVSIEQRMPGIM